MAYEVDLNCSCPICTKRRAKKAKANTGVVEHTDNEPLCVFTTPTSDRLARLNRTWNR